MSDVQTAARSQRSVYRVHYGLQRAISHTPRPMHTLGTSRGLSAYSRQVAGHSHTDNDKYLGLLQSDNGTILKPIIKESQRRELEFYERLKDTDDPDLVELRKFVPKYHGCKKYTYNGHEQDYIILEDLTERMLEPCIMDVKIGKRTWDPLASEEKIEKEKTKYAACKQQYGFCIPGYQVYRITTGQLLKYGKEHGKKMHGRMVVDAIRSFVNGAPMAPRALLVQVSAALWRLQRWASKARRLRLYSASLLLLYDAASLAQARERASTPPHAAPRITRRHSLHSIAGSNFSGQLCSKGPVYRKVNPVPLTCMSLASKTFAPPPPIQSPWTEALQKLNHNHSFEHNYDDKLSKIKLNYHAVLDQLVNEEPNPKSWGTVKIIDFAHAYFNDDEEPSMDENFKEGIDNFINIIETLLKETDDQVF